MAYDPNSAYQPPQRAYYAQTQQQQQAPAQESYRDQPQESYRHGSYDQGYGQEYAQGYDQQQQQQYTQSNGYAQQYTNEPQQEQYSDGYSGGYQRQKPRPISGEKLQQQRQYQQSQPQPSQQYERNYDPRYQQRPGRTTPQGHGQQGGQRVQQADLLMQHDQFYQQHQQQPQQPQQAPRERQGHQGPPASQTRPADPPRNGYPQAGPQQRQPAPRGPQPPPVEQQQQRQADPRNGYPQPSSQQRQTAQPAYPPPGEHQQRQADPRNGLPSQRAAPPQKPSAPPVEQKPKKMTMEEWKAAEKAKMHQANASPEILSFDNAFPVFPNTKKEKRERLVPPDDRSGTAMSKRSSEEQSRSSVGSSGPRQLGERPAGMLRENSGLRDEMVQQQQQPQGHLQASQGRPSMDHKPFSFEPIPARDEQQRPEYGRQPSSGAQRDPQQQVHSPVDERQQQQQQQQQQWPMQNSAPSRQGQRSPVQARGYAQSPPPPVQDLYSRPQSPSQQQARRPGTAGGHRPPVPTIDTAQTRRPQPAAYMDHQPLSPAHVPPRPSTAQAGRSNLQVAPAQSPQSGLSYERTPVGYVAGDTRQPQHMQQESLGDLYDGYNDQEPQSAGPRSDREIEDEMPDFDSAAPSQTSLLHKRSRKGEAPRATATPSTMGQHPNQSAQALSYPKVRQYQQHDDPYQTMAQQKQRPTAPPMPAANGGFDFGVPAQPQRQPSQHQYGYAQRDPAYQAPPVQAPQPSFATEPVARKSMDDARQMPYRGPGPPQPQAQNQGVRFAADEQVIGRGQYPPQQRPGMDDRNFSGQTVQSVQSVQTTRSAPNGYRSKGPGRPPGMDERNVSGGTIQTVRSDVIGQPPRGVYPPQQQQRPGMDDRNFSGQTVQTIWSDPGQQQRVPSAPPLRQGLQEPPGRPPNGAPLSQQRSAPEYADHHRRQSNPDALPHHPIPVRPGLMEGGGQQQQGGKPAPVRNYDATSHVRQASVIAQPVTHQELDQLRAAVNANPNNNKQALLFAKKLVEASTVLASEGGRADPKTTAKNREKYVLEAYKRIKKLASSGYPDAQFYLADCYGQGALGLEVDAKEAFNMYQAAAKQGHPQAAYRTAVCCEMGPEEGGGTRKDYAKAGQWYRRAAALGDVPAMYKLGIILLKGLLGQQRNVGESVIWLKRAAERADKDNPHALHELGMLYESINTAADVRSKLIADDAYAQELFTQASGLGYKFSQFRLGQAYEYGTLGLPIDNRSSISWYSKAAAQGEHQAELALSGWYLTGAEGILEHSDTEAYLWARKAATAEGGAGAGSGKAMFAMGYFSEMGIGCPASVEEARRWYGRAAAYKFPKALERLEELKKSGKSRPAPVNGKLARKDQKRDEAECVVM